MLLLVKHPQMSENIFNSVSNFHFKNNLLYELNPIHKNLHITLKPSKNLSPL